MLISYNIISDQKETKGYEKAHVDYCCSDMTTAMNTDDFIVYGGKYADRIMKYDFYKENQVFIIHKESGYYGDVNETEYEITFCPFCGVRIEYKEVGKIKLVSKEVSRTETVIRTNVTWEEEK